MVVDCFEFVDLISFGIVMLCCCKLRIEFMIDFVEGGSVFFGGFVFFWFVFFCWIEVVVIFGVIVNLFVCIFFCLIGNCVIGGVYVIFFVCFVDFGLCSVVYFFCCVGILIGYVFDLWCGDLIELECVW